MLLSPLLDRLLCASDVCFAGGEAVCLVDEYFFTAATKVGTTTSISGSAVALEAHEVFGIESHVEFGCEVSL